MDGLTGLYNSLAISGPLVDVLGGSPVIELVVDRGGLQELTAGRSAVYNMYIATFTKLSSVIRLQNRLMQSRFYQIDVP